MTTDDATYRWFVVVPETDSPPKITNPPPHHPTNAARPKSNAVDRWFENSAKKIGAARPKSNTVDRWFENSAKKIGAARADDQDPAEHAPGPRDAL